MGLVVGACVAFARFRSRRSVDAVALCLLGAIFGSLGGGLILPTILFCNRWLPLLVSSSLLWAIIGLIVGFGGYLFSCWTKVPEEPPFPEDEPGPPSAKVEWLLHEPKRRWRIPRALGRVLPVLLATAWAFGGAVLLAPADVAIALLAVGVLGLAVAFVLYRQEERLESLEERLRDGRES